MNFPVEIIDYRPEYIGDFRGLNLEWLNRYKLAESHDLAVLKDPKAMILDPGGFIWLAYCDNMVVGSSALIKAEEGEFELAKMAVAPAYRGRGISKLLIERCIDHAKTIDAKKISLYSNHQLLTALKLYEKYGFNYVELVDSPFETADIRMELIL